MAKVFGILTALLLAVAAFVAHKNTEALSDEKEATNTQQSNLEENQSQKQGLVDDIAKLEVETGDLNNERDDLTAKLETQNKANDDLQRSINKKETLAKDKEGKVSNAQQSLADIGKIPDLVREMKSTQKSLADLTNQIGVEETRFSRNEEKQSSLGSTLTTFKDTNRLRRQKQSPPSLNTSVRSIYRNWGFVTIAAGDNENVMKGSTLQVLRNGEPIAKLKVSAVEGNTAAANIINDSLTEGESVFPGDTVVSSVKEETTAPQNTAAQADLPSETESEKMGEPDSTEAPVPEETAAEMNDDTNPF